MPGGGGTPQEAGRADGSGPGQPTMPVTSLPVPSPPTLTAPWRLHGLMSPRKRTDSVTEMRCRVGVGGPRCWNYGDQPDLRAEVGSDSILGTHPVQLKHEGQGRGAAEEAPSSGHTLGSSGSDASNSQRKKK